MLSLLPPFYPRGPIDVSRWLQTLPQDGSLPMMRAWRWLHMPGHAPGHVSLWRDDDRMLIAGDAFITTTQESAYSLATQARRYTGRPQYYTTD